MSVCTARQKTSGGTGCAAPHAHVLVLLQHHEVQQLFELRMLSYGRAKQAYAIRDLRLSEQIVTSPLLPCTNAAAINQNEQRALQRSHEHAD